MYANSTSLMERTCPKPGTHSSRAPFYHWLALGYTFLFILALTANLRVLFKLFHYSRRRFRDHILLLNLCAADLFVTLVYIPSEIYAYTIGQWHNDEVCKILAALKGLGIYVSSCAIVSISLDRYLSIVHPLTVYQSNTRNKLFVAGSWLISAVACIPQLIIFKRFTNEVLCREMCGDILSTHPGKRLAYNISVALFAYIGPLLTIFYSYFRILYVLHKRSDRRTFRFVKCSVSCDGNQSNTMSTSFHHHDRASASSTGGGQSLVQEEINSHSMKTITRAKLKTLKLTVFIVICFVLCWTPYYCIVFFLLITDARINRENAQNLLTKVSSSSDQPTSNERSLLIVMMLAVSNSVLDPLIYGCFLMRSTPGNPCCSKLRPRKEAATFRRARNQLTGEKESKVTTMRSNMKNGNQHQRDMAVECEL